MNWYLTKIVYQIICGDGNHTAQFDEQLRLVCAENEEEAFEKAWRIGKNEEESFCNTRNELVQWTFINVAELYRLSNLLDGAEIYSRIQEADDAAAYKLAVNRKADSIREKSTHRILQLF